MGLGFIRKENPWPCANGGKMGKCSKGLLHRGKVSQAYSDATINQSARNLPQLDSKIEDENN
jgi:hypothetical protein